jgi:hypothetical protein
LKNEVAIQASYLAQDMKVNKYQSNTLRKAEKVEHEAQDCFIIVLFPFSLFRII